MANIDELLEQASEIRDANEEKENTALRVGTMLVDILQYIAGFIDRDTLRQILQEYASLSGAGLVNWRQSRCVFVATMGTELDNIDGGKWEYTSHDGDIVFNPSSRTLRIEGEVNTYFPAPGVIYVNAHTGHLYKWDISTRKMTELVDSSSPTVIDYRNAPAFADIPIGATYYFLSQSSGYKIGVKVDANNYCSFAIDPKKVYAFRDTRQTAVWNADTQTWTVLSSQQDGSAGRILNIKDNKHYRVWVGTAEDLAALGNNLEDDVLYLVGTHVSGGQQPDPEDDSATIDSISYTPAGVNQLQFAATIKPAGKTDTVTWSVTPTTRATINAQTGLLTILQSGQVTVKATGTKSTAQLPVTLTYTEPVEPTGELAVTATRTAANTMTLGATRGGSAVSATYSLAGAVPTVKKLASGALTDVPAVELSGSTLTYHDDCTVTVQATASGETVTKTLTIAHTSDDRIWFEDDAVVSALNSAGIGSAGSVTYGQAASATKVQLINNADITRFNEFRFFTGITNLAYGGSTNRLDGNSNLLCVQLPSSIDRITGNTSTQSPLYGTAITDLFIPDGTSLNAYALAGITSLETLSIDPPDANGFVASSCISGCDNLRTVIVRNTTQSLPSSAFQNHTSIEEVDLGENISELPNSCFRGCTGLTKLTMRYNGFVSFSTSAFYNFSDTRLGAIDLYVPLSQVNTYKADANYAKFKSINAIPN